MAQIQLRKDDLTGPNLWPNHCLRCHKPASEKVPIPPKYCAKEVELAIPLCDKHIQHWQTFQKANLVGIFLIINFVILFPIFMWNWLGPIQGGPNAVGERIAALVVATAGAAILFGLLLLFWVGGSPIKVSEVTAITLTLSGVSRDFARRWAEQESEKLAQSPLEPEVSRFEVNSWRPDGVCPYPGTLYLYFWAILLGGLLGVILGMSMVGLAEFTANWLPNDLRYLLLISLVCAVYTLVASIVLRPPFGLWVFFSLVAAGFILLILGCTGLAAWLNMFPLASALTGIILVPSLLILMIVVNRLVGVNRVRNGWIAGMAGLLGPAVLIGIGFLIMGGNPERSGGCLGLGVILALATCFMAAARAREPFCSQCDTWMKRQFLGGVHRTSQEMHTILAQGEILRLVGEKFKEKAEVRETELAIFHCPNCREGGQVVMELTDFQKNSNGNTARGKAGLWVYPGSVLPLVLEMRCPQVPSLYS